MPNHPPAELDDLMALVRRLRGPDGCPWDREQRLEDLRAYLLEEAHEVADAIDRAVEEGAWEPLAEELGDLLFQIAFLGTLAEEAGAFDLGRSIRGVHHKMVERHPHVFGDQRLADADAVRSAWERRKVARDDAPALLSGVPRALPALVGAYRLTQKAAGVGFDWPQVDGALAKVREEIVELEEAIGEGDRDASDEAARAAMLDELGDLLFAVANVARKLDLDPEAALAAANRKFRRRFGAVEAQLAAHGIRLDQTDLATMDAAWNRVKQQE